MNPTEFYQSLISSIREDDLKTVAGIMAQHAGEKNSTTIESLARKVFGEFNSSTERKVREILERLTVEYHMPVCSVSGKPGRWLAANESEREAAAAELESRGRNTLDRARALRMAVVPSKEPNFTRPKQLDIWR